MTTPSRPRHALRTAVWVILILAVVATLVLVLLTEFPLWGGLIITSIVILPCQIYLNRTKQNR
ncbi:MAG TPA: hypothetical protein VK098_04955 [Beutenbergiaceae bacterium]|nr:hypothetical protein [Beutenbergiaceae bacterium]